MVRWVNRPLAATHSEMANCLLAAAVLIGDPINKCAQRDFKTVVERCAGRISWDAAPGGSILSTTFALPHLIENPTLLEGQSTLPRPFVEHRRASIEASICEEL